MNAILDPIRLPAERTLIDSLFERFGLDVLIDHFVGKGGAVELHDVVLATQLRLTPLIAPRLTGLLTQVATALQFDEPIDMFVAQEATFNAGAVHATSPGRPHLLTLTSGLVERMTDDEIRFVLGHEVGHLAYRHYRARLVPAAFGDSEGGTPKVPALLARRLESWDRLAELSADRAALTVVGGALDVAVRVFFKLQSGLGPEQLRFDVGAFLDQLARLQALDRRELLSQFSHPATPIRVRALQLFAGRAPGGGATIDDEVAALTRLMDLDVGQPLEENARDFLLAGGLLAAHADGAAIGDAEWETLVELLLPVCADPEAELARVTGAEEARRLLDRSMTWLRANTGGERYDLFRNLVHVVAVDGRVRPGEREFLHEVAERLDIPDKAADETLYDVLASYLQSQALRAGPNGMYRGWTSHPGTKNTNKTT